MLAIEVEYLTGLVRAARYEDLDQPEWPPQPDRLFSALVCAWAEAGEDRAEHQALLWLERLPPPELAAPRASRRDVVAVYVPPNDMSVKGKPGGRIPKGAALKSSLTVLPQMRTNRQPRSFPAVCPEHPVVYFLWPQARAGTEIREALQRLASRVSYLGHSSSLVRVAVRCDGQDPLPPATHLPSPAGTMALRWVYEGRLAELCAGYRRAAEANAGRPDDQKITWRPPPGIAFGYELVSEAAAPAQPPPESVFGEHWYVFADSGGRLPALTAFAHIAAAMRRALQSHAGDPVPEVLSGHAPDGSPSQSPHLAIAPLADVGWEHSSGRLLGLGVILPRALEGARHAPERAAVLRALASFARSAGGHGELRLGRRGLWRLAHEPAPTRHSLRPHRYCRPARRWATVTPIVLDRFPKEKDGADAAAIVAAGCERIGLPRPCSVALYKHSAVRGAPSAWPSRGAPSWSDWSLPGDSPLRSRCRRHAVLEFDRPVRGPVILGAGRYQGFGLCLPLEVEAEP
ncbi:MAG: type I-U CRISPR-associated protein Cas5/Cas6 [Planctomycetota bacterium]|nr:MAG: type I-U CRISPR-associated protein Cas5/Cas6 [Planctomycetota bacterium]